jgi:hypothetical protein
MTICKDLVKNRTLRFSRRGDNQAEKAMKLLADVEGIKDMVSNSDTALKIHYDIQQLTFQILEAALTEVGFELDNSLFTQIKRSLFTYCEDAQRSSLGIEQAKADHEALSLSESSAHDPRPDNWRHYV